MVIQRIGLSSATRVYKCCRLKDQPAQFRQGNGDTYGEPWHRDGCCRRVAGSPNTAVRSSSVLKRESGMKRFHVSLLASAVFVLGTAAGLVRADVILVPTATDNGHYDDGNGNISPASNTVDGSGLSTPSLVSNGASVPVTWPTNNASVDGPGFLRSYVAYLNSNVVTYTFASAVNISGGHFWQYGGDDTARCLKTADIYVSSNGTDYSMNGTLTPGYEESATATQDPGVDFNAHRYECSLYPVAQSDSLRCQCSKHGWLWGNSFCWDHSRT